MLCQRNMKFPLIEKTESSWKSCVARNRGNAILKILIAIGLLAALAVTSSYFIEKAKKEAAAESAAAEVRREAEARQRKERFLKQSAEKLSQYLSVKNYSVDYNTSIYKSPDSEFTTVHVDDGLLGSGQVFIETHKTKGSSRTDVWGFTMNIITHNSSDYPIECKISVSGDTEIVKSSALLGSWEFGGKDVYETIKFTAKPGTNQIKQYIDTTTKVRTTGLVIGAGGDKRGGSYLKGKPRVTVKAVK